MSGTPPSSSAPVDKSALGVHFGKIPSSAPSTGYGDVGDKFNFNSRTLKDDGHWNREYEKWYRYTKDGALDPAATKDAAEDAMKKIGKANTAGNFDIVACTADAAGCAAMYMSKNVAELFNVDNPTNRKSILDAAKKISPGQAYMILKNSNFKSITEEVTLSNGKKITRVIPETVESWLGRAEAYHPIKHAADAAGVDPTPEQKKEGEMQHKLLQDYFAKPGTGAGPVPVNKEGIDAVIQMLHLMRSIVIAYPQSLNPAETEGKPNAAHHKYPPPDKSFTIYHYLPPTMQKLAARAGSICNGIIRMRAQAKLTLNNNYMGIPTSIYLSGGALTSGEMEGGANVPYTADIKEIIDYHVNLDAILNELIAIMDETKYSADKQYRIGLKKASLVKVKDANEKMKQAGEDLLKAIDEFNKNESYGIMSGDKVDVFQLTNFPDHWTAEQKKKYQLLFQLRDSYGKRFMKSSGMLQQMVQAILATFAPQHGTGAATTATSTPTYLP